jgi:predicted Zn finger-like uncharacterized protein
VIIQCSSCRTRYHYDEARFAGAPAKKIRCTKCSTIFEIRNPANAAPPPPDYRADETGGAGGPILGSDDFNLDTTAMGPRKRMEPPPPAPAPPPPPGQRGTAETDRPRSLGAIPQGRRLKMPEWERLALACIGGPEQGRIFEIDKPRVILGRANSDIILSDPECSRQHAAIEVAEEKVYLVDLGSTNGTYVAEQRVSQLELENRAEFDIGASTLMLIKTRRD